MNTIYPFLRSIAFEAEIPPLLLATFPLRKKVSAKIVKLYDDHRALIKAMGYTFEVSSDIPLRERGRLLLQVIENDGMRIRFRLLQDSYATAAAKETPRSDRTVRKLLALGERVEELIRKEGLDSVLARIEDLDADSLKRSLRLVFGDLGGNEQLRELLALQNLYWLLGSMSGSLLSYLPVKWEGLGEKSILFKRIGKYDLSICKIYLCFDDIDRVDVTFLLHRRYLSIYFAIENEDFKELVRSRLSELRGRFYDAKVAVEIFVNGYNEKVPDPLDYKEGFVSIRV